MNAIARLLPLIALLLALTYLAIGAAAPDTERHERMLNALRALTLNEAALHRDVLRARDGLLRNYDPLVHSLDELRNAGLVIQGSDNSTDLDGEVRKLRAALDDEEALIETFKSSNALLQNSLSYFGHAIHEVKPDAPNSLATGALASDMLRFIGESSPDNAASATASLENLAQSAPPGQQDVVSLVNHGRLIVTTLPAINRIVAGVLGSPVAGRARTVQDLYLERHGQAAARANRFRLLLYAAAVILAAYLAYLFVRLRINAQTLSARLGFENVIAEISTEFINLPQERMTDGIQQGLARLGEHATVERAYLIQCGADGQTVERAHLWSAEGTARSTIKFDRLLKLASCWSVDACRRQRCIFVRSVRSMPASAERTALMESGISSWLCVPLWRGERRLGILGFETTHGDQRRSDDDIALFRTAGEIFANALERRRTEIENEALGARLRRRQRLEALGTLAGGVAHNFNNVLGAILGYSEMALGKLAHGSQPSHYVEEVHQAGLRAKAVVDQLLAFGRRAEHARKPVLMRDIVGAAVRLLNASLPATISIRLKIDADAAIHGDSTQLQQVVVNLCTNAAHAMDGHGTINVGVDMVAFAQNEPLTHGTLAAGRYVRLTVTDTGHGMDAATLERIFEPFFTTKPGGMGTGLGLATVHGIVADHGGALNVKSRPGAGSSFETYIAATKAGIRETAPAVTPASTGQGETILLVEDERPLMLLGEEMVAALGYEPVGFDKGREALAAFSADPQRFDLVLTDEIMPDIAGTDLAMALHRIRPEMPIILVTGHGAPVSAKRLEASGIKEVLRKPLLSADLAAALARHLAAARLAPMPREQA